MASDARAPDLGGDDRRDRVLTQPALLALNAAGVHQEKAIILRGRFVRENLLCQPLPSPPPFVLWGCAP